MLSFSVFVAVAVFLLLALIEGMTLPSPMANLSKVALATAVVLSIFFFSQVMSVMVIVGIAVCIRRRREPLHLFVLLYLAGILLSLLFLGAARGQRTRIGADILHYLVAAIGVDWLLWRRAAPTVGGSETKPARLLPTIAAPIVAAVVFLAMPFAIRAKAPAGASVRLKGRQLAAVRAEYPEAILFRLLQGQGPLKRKTDSELRALSGQRALMGLQVVVQNTIELSAGDGIEVAALRHLWPLEPEEFRRFVVLDRHRFAILPELTRGRLSELETKGELIAVGSLKTRPGKLPRSTVWALVADELWFVDAAGDLGRIPLTGDQRANRVLSVQRRR